MEEMLLIKWEATNKEYSAKSTRNNFKCDVFGLIHFNEILILELFEERFNTDNFFDILKTNLKIINQV